MKNVKILAIVLTISISIAACTESEAPTNTAENTEPSNTESVKTDASPQAVDEVAEGKKHYTEYCVKCHKEDGTGGKVEIEGQVLKPEDLTTAKMIKEPDEEYIKVLNEGISDEGMPSFKKLLSEDQMKQVVKYIRAELQK